MLLSNGANRAMHDELTRAELTRAALLLLYIHRAFTAKTPNPFRNVANFLSKFQERSDMHHHTSAVVYFDFQPDISFYIASRGLLHVVDPQTSINVCSFFQTNNAILFN